MYGPFFHFMSDSSHLQLLADFSRSFQPNAFLRADEPVSLEILAMIDSLCHGRMSAAEAREFLA